jgi:hypothetical protein
LPEVDGSHAYLDHRLIVNRRTLSAAWTEI